MIYTSRAKVTQTSSVLYCASLHQTLSCWAVPIESDGDTCRELSLACVRNAESNANSWHPESQYQQMSTNHGYGSTGSHPQVGSGWSVAVITVPPRKHPIL